MTSALMRMMSSIEGIGGNLFLTGRIGDILYQAGLAFSGYLAENAL